MKRLESIITVDEQSKKNIYLRVRNSSDHNEILYNREKNDFEFQIKISNVDSRIIIIPVSF